MKIMTASQFTQTNTSSPSVQDKQLDQTVLEILKHVQINGDNALFAYTEKLDGAQLDNLLVSEEEFYEAMELVDEEFVTALNQAKDNITAYHSLQIEKSWFTELENEVVLGQKITPIERVGIYVPGGKAAYPSTVLMNVIPAQLAGVKSLSITTPPNQNGKVNPYVLVAARITGVKRVYKIGGAQAIAALAYGTETVEKVNKIVGPGNVYVARAKKWVYGDVAIDMIAGPSEICIIADETASPRFIAADLLSQAEHDEEVRAICITTSQEVATKVADEVERQLTDLERKQIAETAIRNNGYIIVAETLIEAFEVANEIAPEHLQLMIKNPNEQLRYVQHAGAIFLGNYSPEPLGDYFAGPNHTLPTSGTAKFSSPLGVYDFMKKSSIINYSQKALLQAADQVIKLANTEGLSAHANSIQIRKDDHHA
ncbi:histidinol dehydrogenase [Ornithinibacillus sp. L9]|uniref:Histidinol dehydrogenase n=1 Tax=Ornithinibacillus caprae TaxID=2678566 RepID=A0A6N8FN12_9BACI|nr:histidinol dehydrogenase [Ornithinibacillus caprae]MUK89794.1 histidinol dehydrogenase [Ornithinibacillus caprae]